MQNKGYYCVQGRRGWYQSKARMRLPIDDHHLAMWHDWHSSHSAFRHRSNRDATNFYQGL